MRYESLTFGSWKKRFKYTYRGDHMAFQNPYDEIKHLRKQNKILRRQVGSLKKDLKVDVPKLRQECYKEGYNTAVNQLTGVKKT